MLWEMGTSSQVADITLSMQHLEYSAGCYSLGVAHVGTEAWLRAEQSLAPASQGGLSPAPESQLQDPRVTLLKNSQVNKPNFRASWEGLSRRL